MRFSLQQSLKWSLVSVIIVAIVVALIFATHNILTQPFPGHNDFLSRWEGARSFWVDGLNPYGEQASLNIQIMMYGQPALPDQDQVLFAYPMYTAILLFPLLFTSYAWASAIIMVIMEAMLIASLFLLFDLFKWRPTGLQLSGLILFTLFIYPAARGLILGQLGLVSYFAYVVTFWALNRENDTIAGIALSIATIKPQLGIFIVPFLLLWGLRARRYQFVGGVAVSLLVLVGMSLALVPTWITDMWQQVANYTGYAPPSASDRLFGDVLGIPIIWQYGMYALFWAVMVIGWYQVLVQGKLERAMWVAMITLAVNNIALPVTATPHFVVFVIPVIFYLAQLSRRGKNLWVWGILAILLIEPWVRFFLTVDYAAQFESWWMFYHEPIAVLISLWFTRKLWWNRGNVLRPKVECNPQIS